MSSESRIKGMPEISYGDECCSICLQEYVRGDICRVLPRCGHMFHKDCVDTWLLNRSLKCPVCRRLAVVEDKPRRYRKPHINGIKGMEWIIFGAFATIVVIAYGSVAYSICGSYNAIKSISSVRFEDSSC